jgi:SagB-type dehydrogenase family enzyme
LSKLIISVLLILFTATAAHSKKDIIKLPSPEYEGTVSVEEAIYKRKSTRSYKKLPLTSKEVSQLLWASAGLTIDGITGATRSYPSAGASYPIKVYLIAGDVKGLDPGIYHYEYRDHTIKLLKKGDYRKQLTSATFRQNMVSNAPISLVFTALYSKTTSRYGERGRFRYISMDLGHAGQNVHLQAEALGLGTVVVGAFNDEAVKKVLNITEEHPLYIMPVGKK